MTSPTDRSGIAAALDALRDSLDDTCPEHQLINILSWAIKTGRAEQLEAHLSPLVERWIAERSLDLPNTRNLAIASLRWNGY